MKTFDDIRRIVLTDPQLMNALTAIRTEPELFDAVIELGRRNNIEVTTAELERLINVNRRIWLERWIPR